MPLTGVGHQITARFLQDLGSDDRTGIPWRTATFADGWSDATLEAETHIQRLFLIEVEMEDRVEAVQGATQVEYVNRFGTFRWDI
jgi:hypothetical protein